MSALLRAGSAALAQRGMLPSDLQYPFLVRGFLCVLVLAPMLGGVSHLVVTRRMAFFSAALGQAALTGVAIGLLLGEPLNAPYGGMFGFCLLSTLGDGLREAARDAAARHADRRLSRAHARPRPVPARRADAAVQRAPGRVGAVRQPADRDRRRSAAAARASASSSPCCWCASTTTCCSTASARRSRSVAGAEPAYLEYFFALLLTLSIVVSLKIIGALLVEALVVVPAAAARNVARGTRSYLMLERRGRVPRRRRRPRHLDALPGADRRRGGAGGQRDLLPDAGGPVAPAAAHGVTPATLAIRRVEIRPPSARVELANVVRFGMVIVVGVWMYLAADSATFGGEPATTTHLLPFQTLIQDRPPLEQRMFRELQEGLLEAEARRSATAAGPIAAALAADGIPPFALDPDRQGRPVRLAPASTAPASTISACRAARRRRRGCCSSRSRNRACRPIRRAKTKNTIGCSTAHAARVDLGSCRCAAASRNHRAPQAEGWTQLYAVGPR